MSAGSSINLSEFFNDGDSEGHRFLNFIKNKRGRICREQKFLFIDQETERLSFNVQLEKLPTPQLKDIETAPQTETNKSQIKNSEHGKENEKASENKLSSDLSVNFKIPETRNKPSTTSESQHPNDTNRGSSRWSIRRSGGLLSSRDRLRRLSMKNCNSNNSKVGRRSLMKEFDSMVDYCTNFAPSTCSTPVLQPTSSVPQLSNHLAPTGSIETGIANKTIASSSCCDSLIRTLQRKDDELKNYMESILDKTLKNIEGRSKLVQEASRDNTATNKTGNSTASKRTFTLERGSVPQQFILTPDKSKVQNNPISSSQRSPTRTNLATVKIPETQHLPNMTDTMICSNNQTIKCQRNHSNINNHNQEKNCTLAAQRLSFQLAEENQNLDDILTDDEEHTNKSTFQNEQHVNETPLNLVQNFNLNKKRPGKCASEKLFENNVRQMIAEPEIEIPPPAHSKKKINKKKYKPLNRPPGTPLNGEKYAQELARMSNYEILDLRKRNSLGQIFTISECKTRRMVEEINKKKHQLDDQIEQELLKRNMGNVSLHPMYGTDIENPDQDIRLSVPYNFRDSESLQEKNNSNAQVPDFIDENSFDRVKFTSKGQRAKVQTPEVLKQYLEISKRYSKRKSNKLRNRTSKRSLYSNQSIYPSDEHDSSGEKSCSTEKPTCGGSRQQSIPFLKSPRISRSNLITSPKVVSPPPVSDVQGTKTGELENTSNNQLVDGYEHVSLPPPPPGFESNSTTITNNTTNQYSTNVTLEIRTINEDTTNNKLNDEHLFKIPTKPAPKRRVRNPGKSLKVIQESTEENQIIDNSTDLTEGGSLRRSKRGQVPRVAIPVLGMLHDQLMELEKKRKAAIKKKQREYTKQLKKLAKQNKLLDFTANSGSSKNSSISISKKVAKADEISDSGNPKSKTKTQNTARSLSQRQNIESSGLTLLNDLPPAEHPNNEFDQLKQNTLTSDAAKTQSPPSQYVTKNFKIRIRRGNTPEVPPTVDNAGVSSTSTFSNASTNTDLVSWLKNMGGECNSDQQASESLKDMRISNGTSLCFTELQGVEYAFYDTVERASLGYLRFRPLQVKPRKKAKRFDLHFINMVGLFRITVNSTERVLSVGDMITIAKLSSYDIQNLCNEVGILMVIKK